MILLNKSVLIGEGGLVYIQLVVYMGFRTGFLGWKTKVGCWI